MHGTPTSGTMNDANRSFSCIVFAFDKISAICDRFDSSGEGSTSGS